MLNGLLHAHSGLRWIVLILLVLAVLKSLAGWLGNKEYTKVDRKLSVYTFMTMNVQFIIGLVLYSISPKVLFTADTMGNSMVRFYTVEHITLMIIAIIVISIGYSKAKKATENLAKHKNTAIMFGIGLLLILAAIPWPFRGLGAGWF
ncbi:MAG: cytochrome B [Balneolaceae bacterium]